MNTIPVLLDQAEVLNEAKELIALSENLFETKFYALQLEMNRAATDQEKNAIQQKAQQVYENYRKSLQAIKNFYISERKYV